MSSRGEHRRHERDWERDDRDRDRDRHPRSGGSGRGGRQGHYKDEPRRRSSRSRSPRHGDRDRRPDRRDYRKDDDRRRDDDRRDDRRHRERDGDRDRDRRDGRDDRRRDEREYPRGDRRDEGRREEPKAISSVPPGAKERSTSVGSQPPPSTDSARLKAGGSKVKVDDAMDGQEEGEEADTMTEDDAAMMAMMGVAGFGSTKGKHVTGNQEGSVDIKKVRTWRQYMNRRGGFNRPLDKIK